MATRMNTNNKSGEEQNKKDFAIVIFFDENNNVGLKKRENHLYLGAEYLFWGVGLEANESKESAISRVLKEELGFIPKKIKFWTIHEFNYLDGDKTIHATLHVFLSPITDEVIAKKVYTGSGMVFMNIQKAITLMSPEDTVVLAKYITEKPHLKI